MVTWGCGCICRCVARRQRLVKTGSSAVSFKDMLCQTLDDIIGLQPVISGAGVSTTLLYALSLDAMCSLFPIAVEKGSVSSSTLLDDMTVMRTGVRCRSTHSTGPVGVLKQARFVAIIG